MGCFAHIQALCTLPVCWCLCTDAGELAFQLDAFCISSNRHHLTLRHEKQKKKKKTVIITAFSIPSNPMSPSRRNSEGAEVKKG